MAPTFKGIDMEWYYILAFAIGQTIICYIMFSKGIQSANKTHIHFTLALFGTERSNVIFMILETNREILIERMIRASNGEKLDSFIDF